MLELVWDRGVGKQGDKDPSFGELLNCFSLFSETAKGILVLSH